PSMRTTLSHTETLALHDALPIFQRTEDLLERHAAAPRRDEVPPAPVIAEGQVRRQNPVPSVQDAHRLFDVDVIDAVRELVNELDRVQHLPVEVAGVEVDAERRAVADGLQRALRRPIV